MEQVMRKIILLGGVLLLAVFAGPARALVLSYKAPLSGGLRFQKTSDISLQLTTTGWPHAPLSRKEIQRAIYRETATDVSPDRVMSLTRQMVSGNVTASPEPAIPVAYSLPKTQSFIRLTGQGRVLSARTFWDNNMEDEESKPPPPELDLSALALDLETLEAMLSHVPFPEGEVQPDQVWTNKFRLPDFLGGLNTPITLTTRLLGTTQYAGRECAKLRTAFEMPFIRQYPALLDLMQIPSDSRDNLTTQGRVAGRIEWLFDIKQGCLVAAEGPLEISAKSGFYFFDSQSHSVDSFLTMSYKSYNKTQLLEADNSTPAIN
jgi:hypothetical protein